MIGDHQGRGEAATLALASGVQHVVKAGLPPLVEHHKYILQSSMIGLKYHIVEHVNQREVLLSWKNTNYKLPPPSRNQWVSPTPLKSTGRNHWEPPETHCE